MLYLIGTGLCEKDISIGALEIIDRCKKVYLESYTSKIPNGVDLLEKFCRKKISILFRQFLENDDSIILEARNEDVSLLIIGTPFFATTHTEILIRAKSYDVRVKTFHNNSILNSIGCCGLYSYAFGRTVSIPFFESDWEPTSFYRYINENIQAKLHTLCLLDIRVDANQERYMSANTAIKQLMKCEDLEGLQIINQHTEIFVICRFGSLDEKIVFGKIADLADKYFGEPLHSIIIPAKLDVIEREHVQMLF